MGMKCPEEKIMKVDFVIFIAVISTIYLLAFQFFSEINRGHCIDNGLQYHGTDMDFSGYCTIDGKPVEATMITEDES